MSSKKNLNNSRLQSAASPTKTYSQISRAREIETRENLSSLNVESAHQATTEYLIVQHREVVGDLRNDIEILQRENETLRHANSSYEREILTLRQQAISNDGAFKAEMAKVRQSLDDCMSAKARM